MLVESWNWYFVAPRTGFHAKAGVRENVGTLSCDAVGIRVACAVRRKACRPDGVDRPFASLAAEPPATANAADGDRKRDVDEEPQARQDAAISAAGAMRSRRGRGTLRTSRVRVHLVHLRSWGGRGGRRGVGRRRGRGRRLSRRAGVAAAAPFAEAPFPGAVCEVVAMPVVARVSRSGYSTPVAVL